MQIISHDHFQLRNYLAIKLARVVQCTAQQSDLEQQLKWDECGRQIDDLWAAAAQVFANQIEIASETAIGSSQAPIDAPVLEGPKDSAGQRRDRKLTQNVSIIKRGMRILRMSHGRDARATFANVAIKRKRISRILILRIIEFRKRCMSRQEIISITLISSKLDLSRRVRCQHFIEPKVEFFITKLRNRRREVNRAAITDPRLSRHSSERRNLDRVSRQGFNVETQQELN